MAQLISESDDYKYIKRNVMTISEWLWEWPKTYKIGFVKKSTIRFYRDIIKVNIEPYIGYYPIQELTTWDIQKELISKLMKCDPKKNKKTLSAKYIMEIYRVLDMALTAAVKKINKRKSNRRCQAS